MCVCVFFTSLNGFTFVYESGVNYETMAFYSLLQMIFQTYNWVLCKKKCLLHWQNRKKTERKRELKIEKRKSLWENELTVWTFKERALFDDITFTVFRARVSRCVCLRAIFCRRCVHIEIADVCSHLQWIHCWLVCAIQWQSFLSILSAVIIFIVFFLSIDRMYYHHSYNKNT